MKHRKWLYVLIAAAFAAGLFGVLYPVVRNHIFSEERLEEIKEYEEETAQLPQNENEKMLAEAEAYNEALKEVDAPFRNFEAVEGYEDILNVSGTGIMGYISIEKIGVELPIYHGLSDSVLQKGAGHMQGSSFPVGGIGTHAVISAHCGIPDAELFTNLEKLSEGDTFTIRVLNRTLTYQVDQIKVVEPQELEELYADAEHDYCTLVTCTPYGVNSHRLFVRGVRVTDTENIMDAGGDAYRLDTDMIILVVFAVLLAGILLVSGIVHLVHHRKRRGKENEED